MHSILDIALAIGEIWFFMVMLWLRNPHWMSTRNIQAYHDIMYYMYVQCTHSIHTVICACSRYNARHNGDFEAENHKLVHGWRWSNDGLLYYIMYYYYFILHSMHGCTKTAYYICAICKSARMAFGWKFPNYLNIWVFSVFGIQIII